MAQGFTVLEPTGKWVTDAGDMLSDSEERWLSQKLAAYEDTTSTQIVIVTLPDMNGVPASEYAIELGRQWRVGQQGQDNGIVILASRNDRKLFIATGYGLEGAIPDAIASRIIQNIIVPNFRQGNFYNGFSSATDALINAARGEYSASPQDRGVPIDIDTIITLIFIAVFLYSVISRGGGSSGGRHHRRRGDFPVILWGPTFGGGSGGGFGGGGFGGGGFGGFGGGGGSFGGGGAGGGW
ncbi:MAG: YgcG family protein [Rhodothermales bacterium]